MSCGRRQLFVYYRVPGAQLPQAIDAAQRMQHALCAASAGLQAALMRRPEPDDKDEVTLMETYAVDALGAPHGIDDALHARIEAVAQAALGSCICGARHVEVFDACA